MTTYVLTRPENAPSATRLGYPVSISPSQIPQGSSVIRWGTSEGTDSTTWGIVLNHRSVLSVSVNKLQALRALARTVRVPDIYEEGARIPRGVKAVVREVTHSEGSGFELQDGPLTVPAGYHATRFISNTREYRVWFVRDSMMAAKRVPRTREGQTEADPCRSKWGYSFCDMFPKLFEACKKARQAIPLDFGAMDVLWSPEDSEWYFLEINSAPSLDHDKVLLHFKRGISEIVSDGEPEPVATSPLPRRAADQEDSELRSAIQKKIKDKYDKIYKEELKKYI